MRTSVRHRRRADNDETSHERWLVSYADFITLLFAFFVVMYAISTLNEGKYRVLSEAIVHAFGKERIAAVPSASPPLVIVKPAPKVAAEPATKPVPGPAEVQRKQQEKHLMGLANQIADAMTPLVQTGNVRFTQTGKGLAVEISASVLFAPGQAALQPDSVKALQSVAQVLAAVENEVQVEGHTDNIPIANTPFPSNWELSSARASSVVRLFTVNGVSQTRLVAVGYADNRPVEANDTAAGRARNRRVTLLIVGNNPIVADPGDGNLALQNKQDAIEGATQDLPQGALSLGRSTL